MSREACSPGREGPRLKCWGPEADCSGVFSPRSILVVVEHDDVRRATVRALRAAHSSAAVTVVGHVQEALIRLAVAGPTLPEVVVLDLGTSGDVRGLLDAAATVSPTPSAVLLVGEAEVALAEKMADVGFPVLRKPFGTEDLAAAIAIRALCTLLRQ